jgi:hypothetical protein
MTPTWDHIDATLRDLVSLRATAEELVRVRAENARLRAEIARIADDYHPDHPRDNGQALAEMREALGHVLANTESAKAIPDNNSSRGLGE